MANKQQIIFSGPMIRAILNDQKMATRRILKPQPSENVHQVNLDWLRGGHESQDRQYGLFTSEGFAMKTPER